MLSYTADAIPGSAMASDGINFDTSEPGIIIGNRPIPGSVPIYFEVEILDCTHPIGLRYIPIYLGIHKEPSLGILNANCCLGAAYFIEDKDYDIVEQYGQTPNLIHQVPDKIWSRVPAKSDTLGVLIDPITNTITIYNNEKKFYSFSPKKCVIREGLYYPTIYFSTNYRVKGRVNFGKFKFDFPKDGAFSLYSYYFRGDFYIGSIPFSYEVIPVVSWLHLRKDVPFNFEMQSDYNIGDYVSVVCKSNGASIDNNSYRDYTIFKQSNVTDYLKYGHSIFSEKQIPKRTKVYLECSVKNGTMAKYTAGIPVSLGITNSDTSVEYKSSLLVPYHDRQSAYRLHNTISGNRKTEYLYDVLTPIAPSQGKTIGIAFDIENNLITYYFNNIKFFEYHLPMGMWDYRDEIYFVIHNEGLFSGSVECSVNFGESKFTYSPPVGYISLFDYYNHFYKIPIVENPEIIIKWKAMPYKIQKRIFIPFSYYCLNDGDEYGVFSKPGINRMMRTYNTVSDDEAHFVPSLGIKDLNRIVKKFNNDYTPDAYFDDQNENFHGDPNIKGTWV